MKRLILALCLLLPGVVLAQVNIPSGSTTHYVPFIAVDSTDKVTRETGLSNFTVYRKRENGSLTAMTTPTVVEDSPTDAPGVYRLLLDEDTTIGAGNDTETMTLHITHAGMEPVTMMVNLYRPKLTAGQTLTVSGGSANAAVQSIASNAINAAAIADGAIDSATFATDTNPLFGILRRGTAQSATSTTLVLDSGASFGDDTPIGATLVACGSAQGYCQSRLIKDYDGSTDTATVSAWPVTPSGTITYYLFASAPGEGGSGGGASIEDIEGLLPSNFASMAISSNGIVQADVRQYGGSNGTFTSGAPTVRLSTGTGTGQISLSSGAVTVGTVNDKTGYSLSSSQTFSTTGSVGSVTGNVGGTVNGLTATAQGNVRSALGLASANLDTQLSTIAGYLDTEIAAILQDTGTTLDQKINDIQAVVAKLDDTLEINSGTYRFTGAALAQAPTGSGGGGVADWTADERTAIRTILGVPTSGSTPVDPSTGILDTIRDTVATRASQASVDALPDTTEFNARTLPSADYGTASAQSATHAAVTATLAVANKLDAMIEDDGGTPRFTANALEEAPIAAEVTVNAGDVMAAVQSAQGLLTGSCTSGSNTTCVDASRTESSGLLLKDRLICFSDGWCGLITTFNPATDTITTTKVAPSTRSGKSYQIFPATKE